MTNGKLNRIFDLGDESPTADQRSSESLPLPSLEDRVNLYLRAVHGISEFTDQQRSDGREKVLDAMVTSIETARDNAAGKKDAKLITSAESGALVTNIAAILQNLEKENSARVYASASRVLISEALADEYSAYVRSSAADLAPSETPLPRISVVRKPQSIKSSRGRLARNFIVFAAAAVVLLCLLITISPWAPNAPPPTVVAQFPPAESRTASVGEPYATVPSEISAHADSRLAVGLLKVGNELIGTGDVSAARLVLKEAADAGSASAAFALAGTYDPIEIEKLGRKGVSPDIGLAKAWYGKAKNMGSTEAAERLNRLAGRNQ